MSDTTMMPSWRVRPQERERGLPGSPRIWALAGGTLLAVTLLAAGAWWWLGEGAGRGVPLVRAESTPFRVRPSAEQRGGMVVANQGSEVFERNSVAARPGEARLGSGPEAPRPDVLRQPAAGPPQAAPQPAQQQQGQQQQAQQQQGQQQQAQQQQVGGAARAPAPPPPGSVLQAPAIAPPVAPATGRVQVQIAATRSEETAQSEWRRLAARIPELQGRQPVVARLDRGEGQAPMFRIRTGGFADAAAARAFCEQLRAREQGCMVVAP